MTLKQLRFLLEIQRRDLNISRAAEALYTSQSGISKQIQLLEQELGIELFVRKGKHLLGFSDVGSAIVKRAEEVLGKVEDIRLLAEEFGQQNQSLTIATTHTQARYMLPSVVDKFIRRYPDIKLHIHQGNPTQIAWLLEKGEADIAIATEALSERASLLAMPCYQWSRSLIMRRDHDLAKKSSLTLQDIAQYPIITYEQGFTGRARLDQAFSAQQLQPEIVLTAVDADVIKTYVRLGLGIGIIADMAFNPLQDGDLAVVSVKQHFGLGISQVAVKKDKYLKDYIYRFIEMLAPHLSADIVKRALACDGKEAELALFKDFRVPGYQLLLQQK